MEHNDDILRSQRCENRVCSLVALIVLHASELAPGLQRPHGLSWTPMDLHDLVEGCPQIFVGGMRIVGVWLVAPWPHVFICFLACAALANQKRDALVHARRALT